MTCAIHHEAGRAPAACGRDIRHRRSLSDCSLVAPFFDPFDLPLDQWRIAIARGMAVLRQSRNEGLRIGFATLYGDEQPRILLAAWQFMGNAGLLKQNRRGSECHYG